MDLWPQRPGIRLRRVAGTSLATAAVAFGAASCLSPAAHSHQAPAPLMARVRPPASAVSVLAAAPDVVAAKVAGALFAAAPVVAVATARPPGGLAAAARRAIRAHAPLLLTGPRYGAQAVSGALRAEIHALRPRAILAVGVSPGALAARLPRTQVVISPASLPATRAPAPLRRVVVLLRQGDSGPAAVAAAATAQVAGAQVITVDGYDPRADPRAITALAAARPRQVLALGAGFGPARRLGPRLAVAATGVQLPGGGQVLFPRRRLVALYGHPGTPALGVLGQQGLRASIARASRTAGGTAG